MKKEIRELKDELITTKAGVDQWKEICCNTDNYHITMTKELHEWYETLSLTWMERDSIIRVDLALGARVGLLSQQTVSKSQGNGKRTQPITHLASTKQIYNLLNQFLCSLLSSVCTQFVCSLLGHVTTVSPLGKPQKNLQFTEQIYLKFTEPLVQSVFFQFAE